MKRIIFLIASALLFSCANKEELCPEDKPVYTALETTYFYSEASTANPIQGKIYAGDDISIMAGIGGAKWWIICHKGKEGRIEVDKIEYKDKDESKQSLLDSALDETSLLYFISYVLFFGIISFLIAYFIGRKKKIGLWLSLAFGILLTPFVSLFLTLFSRKKENTKEFSKPIIILRKAIGVLLILGAIFGVLLNVNATKQNFQPYFIAIGLIGYGIYFFK